MSTCRHIIPGSTEVLFEDQGCNRCHQIHCGGWGVLSPKSLLQKHVEASSNAWKLFVGKPRFFVFYGFLRLGVVKFHFCSGDLYEILVCQVQKLKTEETAIKVSCITLW